MKLINSIKEKIGERKLLTTAEAGDVLGMCRQTINNYIDKGALPCKEVGGRKYINADSLIALSDTLEEVESCRQKAVSLKEQFVESVNERKAVLDNSRAKNTLFSKLHDSEFSGLIVRHVLSMGKSVLSEHEYNILEYLLKCNRKSHWYKNIDYLLPIAGCSKNYIGQIINTKIPAKFRNAKDYAALEEENKRLKKCVHLLYEAFKRYKVDVSKVPSLHSADTMTSEANILDKKLIDFLGKGLSNRTINCLYSIKVKTISDLVECSRARVRRIRNLGNKSMGELDSLLDRLHLAWGMDVDLYREKCNRLTLVKELYLHEKEA